MLKAVLFGWRALRREEIRRVEKRGFCTRLACVHYLLISAGAQMENESILVNILVEVIKEC